MSEVPWGVHGKILEVDLSSGRIEETPLETSQVADYIGGRGLGARLFSDRSDPGCDALSPDNIIVVDGANVAWSEQTSDGKPKVSNLVAMRQALVDEGYEPIIIIDASLRHDVDDANQLEGLIDNQRVRQSPAGTEADYFILKTADQTKTKVVSNDTFEKYRDDYDWIWERRLPYMIVEGKVLLHHKDD